MKLYEAPSPNARRVHIAMAEKGIELDRVAVDIRGGENLSDEFLAKNPGGRVPVLELDDGTYIGESVSISRYLDAIGEGPMLFGDTPLAQAQIDMWQRRAELNFFLEVAGAFRNITGFFKDRETCVEAWGVVCADRAPKALSMFDAQLEHSEFLAGDQFSVADITLGVGLDFARSVKVVELPELPNIKRWHMQLNARASFSAS
ncbi:MAG TPA: glutathione S-transferase [Gammaproteobacteria bacterium]|jgi:glutathione S-transferase|nr:glutathione S-transferase [Gammaproteobacteria bacterium]HCG70287.1 glutathione S-transferase [Gammaproteobacteria bacterium]